MADGRMKAIVEEEEEEEEEAFARFPGVRLSSRTCAGEEGAPSRKVVAKGEIFTFGERRESDEATAWDLKRKRFEMFNLGRACENTAASSSAAEESPLPVASEYNSQSSSTLSENEATYILSQFSRHFCHGNTQDSKDRGGVGKDKSDNRDVEDVKIHTYMMDDILHKIFSFLDQKNLCRVGATCKEWRAVSTHEYFWRRLKFENTRISQKNFAIICHRYRNATELNLSNVPNTCMLAREAMASLRHLETLILERGVLSYKFFHALSACPALSTLSISEATIYDEDKGIGDYENIFIHHDRLRDLRILKCYLVCVSLRCCRLQTLSLKHSTMMRLKLHCPQLHVLDLSSCRDLGDFLIRSAVMTCPLLASLDMSSCTYVSDETLREIASACPNLSALDVSYCPNVSFESVRLPMLTELKLHTCDSITSASIGAISHSHMLEVLQFHNCGQLSSISLDLPHLRDISLVHLPKFVYLNLRSPKLASIKASRCSALQHVTIISNALQKLVLEKQESLATLSLQCQNLIDVDLDNCVSLTNSICQVFSEGGGCPILRSLVLNNCKSLSMVELNSHSLVSLSLVGCSSMSVLQLSCPNLQKLNLDGCDLLKRASFCHVGLESLNLGICPMLTFLQIEAQQLLILELTGCGMLSQALVNCPRLTSLDARFCREIKDGSFSRTAASCPNIQSLILSSCTSIGADGLSSLCWLQQLTLLDLSYTHLMSLQPVFDNCLQLKILNLSACKNLADSCLDALYKEHALPSLRELDLSYSSVGQTAISHLLSCCTNLVHLNLNGCTNLRDLVWGSSNSHSCEDLVEICPSNSITKENEHLLEVLNCTGCSKLEKVFIPSMSNCFHLSKLSLKLSVNLREVDLTCCALRTLNLSKCSSLEILKLDCPRLINLQLQGCSMLTEENLESAILRCNMLVILNVNCCPKIKAADFGRLCAACPSLKHIYAGGMGSSYQRIIHYLT
ncbi:F-box/LRR-repeat protein 15-like isoform X1 [Ananas comosus]|uniref:F-box/LRR-repeat protein 15-like isoform X1 n=1 Tax=Ananas comosus TaxID=4615 RepID=A0A6P5FX03_ANACO|nr:F-box/LRR-repeat protein 15-like isoform X1 [Ananas comosus]